MPFKFSIKSDTKKLTKFKRDCNKLNKTEIEWGWINGKAYPKSDINGRGGIPFAVVATANEFGQYVKNMKTAKYIYIPARPYFRQSIRTAKKHSAVLSKEIFQSLAKGEDIKPYLENIGKKNVQALKESVDRQNMRKLHPKTVAIKDSPEQWNDTGKMMDNISYKVIYKRSDYKG